MCPRSRERRFPGANARAGSVDRAPPLCLPSLPRLTTGSIPEAACLVWVERARPGTGCTEDPPRTAPPGALPTAPEQYSKRNDESKS